MHEDSRHAFPIAVEVEEGQGYRWCSCAQSKTPPLCDKQECGSKVVYFVADLTEVVYLCNCKHTKNPPWCDGSHAGVLREAIKRRQQK